MKKIISICLLCIISVSMFTSCGKPNIEGDWGICKSNGAEIENCYINFKDDGTVELGDDVGEYELIDDDTIKIIFDDNDYKCNFKIINKRKKLIYLGKLSDEAEKRKLKIDAQEFNRMAADLAKATNSVITDLDEKNIFYENDAIICSDRNKSINSIPKNANEDFDFIDAIKKFYNIDKDYEYIIQIQHGVCVSAVVVNSSDKNVVGSYPAKNQFKDMNLDEVYETFKNDIE